MPKVLKEEQLPHSRLKLEIELTPAEVVTATEAAVALTAKKVQLKGFRQGQAPAALVRESVGESHIADEALNQLLNESYSQVMSQTGRIPLAAPNISLLTKFDPAGQQPLRYTAEVEVYPSIEIKEYSSIRVAVPTPAPVTEADVNAVIEEVRAGMAERTDKAGMAALGDMVEIDFSGSESEVKLEKLQSKNHPVWLGKTQLVAGFEEQLIGTKAGEQKTFTISYPTDFPAQDLASKVIEFAVTINKVVSVNLPEVTDEFAAKIGFATLLELRAKFRENVAREREQEARLTHQGQVLEALLKRTTVEVPVSLIDQQVHSLISQLTDEITRMGGNFLSYLAHRKLTSEQLEEELRPRAERDVAIALALAQIAKTEGLAAPSEPEGESAERQLLGAALDRLVALATSEVKADNTRQK